MVPDDGGSAALVSSETGRVFAAGDVDDCARALAEALTLAGGAETEAACRAGAKEFDWAVRVEAYEALYERATSL